MSVPERAADQQVLADWAVRSSHPDRSMGYEVLTASGNRKRAERIIWASGTGTPQGERLGKPDALPWLTFTGDVEGDAVVGVIQLSWSDARDGTGQPIVPARLVALPWPDQPLVGPGFYSLFLATRALTWSGVTGPPISTADGTRLSISVPPMDVEQLSVAIEKIGFEWLLNIAVALLDRQQVVIIMPAEPFSLEQRVAILDAACALLPYGCRSWISAATWANDRSEHQVRLTFAATARPGQCEMPFTTATAPGPRIQAAAVADYQRVMTQLRAAGLATSVIVAHLAARHEPLRADQAAQAVKHLEELRLPEAVHDEIRRSAGDPHRVERVLARLGWPRLPALMHADYVRFLADIGSTYDGLGAQARHTLGRYWTTETCEALAEQTSRELASAGSQRPRTWLNTVAAVETIAPGALAALSAAILRRTAASDNARQAASTLALLRDTPGSLRPGNAAAWRVLAAHPGLGARFLRDDIADLRMAGSRFQEHYTALSPYATLAEGRWLRLVSDVVERRPLTGAELASDGAVDPSVLLLLLDLAVTTDQVGHFVTVTWPHLLELVFRRSTDGGAGLLVSVQEALSSRKLDYDGSHYPVAMAVMDVLSLAVTGTTPHLTGQPGDQLAEDYLSALRMVWLSPVLDSKRNQLADQLPTAVLNRVLDARSFTRLVAVVNGIDQQLLSKPALHAVADHLEHDSTLLLTLPLDEWWTNGLIKFVPGFDWLSDYSRLLKNAQVATTPARVLYDGYRVLRGRGASTAVAMQAIRPWLQANGVDGLTHLLALCAVRGRKDKLELRTGSYGDEIYDAVQEGALGPTMARDFGSYVWKQYEIYAALHDFDQTRQRSRPRRSKSVAVDSAKPADSGPEITDSGTKPVDSDPKPPTGGTKPADSDANPEEPGQGGIFKVVRNWGSRK